MYIPPGDILLLLCYCRSDKIWLYIYNIPHYLSLYLNSIPTCPSFRNQLLFLHNPMNKQALSDIYNTDYLLSILSKPFPD